MPTPGSLMSFRGRLAPPALMLLAIVVLTIASPVTADTVLTIQGESHDTSILSIDGRIVKAKGRTFDLHDLRKIERSVQVKNAPLRAARLFLVDGSTLIGENVVVADGQVTFDWAYSKQVTLPVEAVRGVTLSPLTMRDEKLQPEQQFADALDTPIDRTDTLYVKQESGIVTVQGILEQLTDEQATFVWNDEPRSISGDKLYGFTLATVGKAPPQAGRVTARLADSSVVTGDLLGLADNTLRLRLVGDAEAVIPWKQVARIDIHSPRMIFISDLTPTDVRQDGWPTYAWTPRMDQTVMGGPIRLDGRSYERGIGVIAHTRLVYDIGGQFDELAAIIGIDDDAAGRGDCIFVVEADGREVLRQRQRGNDQPTPISVNVSGIQRLVLIVEKGEQLNLGDHADWADARLIRRPAE